jgi:hypothetical protein
MSNLETYFYFKSSYRSDEKPFKLAYRSAGIGVTNKKAIGWLEFATEREAKAEADRLNAFGVEECRQPGCARRVFRHEVEARECRGDSDGDCKQCFEKLIEGQLGAVAAGRGR